MLLSLEVLYPQRLGHAHLEAKLHSLRRIVSMLGLQPLTNLLISGCRGMLRRHR